MNKTLLRGGQLVTADGLKKTNVLIDVKGAIEAIGETHDHKDEEIDCTGKLLFPLLIDCHVHFREPGLEHKATMQTEGAAALAGGVGCVCEMPNTIPPTVTVAALADKVRRAAIVDGCIIKFFFGVTEEAHLHNLQDLWTGSAMDLKRLKHHCSGLKLFLDHSTGNQRVDGGIVDEVFRVCGELKIPIVAHCEDSEMNDVAKKTVETQNFASLSIDMHSTMRPPESEVKSIGEAIALARKHKTALHIAHLSTSGGIELVRQAKKDGISVTCEVSPHHLLLSTDDYATLGSLGKMNPPLRQKEHQNALWKGIADGTVDCISTDHAPHTLEEKNNPLPLSAPNGVPGVETMFPLLLTEASKENARCSYTDIVRLCFTNPNRIFSLHQHGIEKGATARIVIVDPKKEWILHGKDLKTKCRWTPFEGRAMKGAIERVIAH